MWRNIIVLFTVLSLMGCAPDEDSLFGKDEIRHFSVRNSNFFDISHPSVKTKVETIKLSKELTSELGGNFHDYAQINDDLLVLDRWTSEIVCLDKHGRLLWRIIPPEPGIDRYTTLGGLDVDQANQEIYVEDRGNNKIDVFNFRGEFQRTLNSDHTHLDFIVLKKDKVLSDISEIANYWPDDQYTYRFRFWGPTKKDGRFTRIHDELNFAAAPVVNFNRFNRVGGVIQHRIPFEDTLFKVNIGENYEVEPLLTFSFSNNSEFKETFLRKNDEFPFITLRKQEFPIPDQVVYDNRVDLAFFLYDQGAKKYFEAWGSEDVIIPSSNFYVFDGKLIDAPSVYVDGVFYQTMYNYKYDYLQKALAEGHSMSEIRSNLASLEEEIGDNDGVSILAVEIISVN